MKKARCFKLTLIIISITLLLLSVAASLIVYYYPKEKILVIVTSQAEKIIKRKVAIDELSAASQFIKVLGSYPKSSYMV